MCYSFHMESKRLTNRQTNGLTCWNCKQQLLPLCHNTESRGSFLRTDLLDSVFVLFPVCVMASLGFGLKMTSAQSSAVYESHWSCSASCLLCWTAVSLLPSPPSDLLTQIRLFLRTMTTEFQNWISFNSWYPAPSFFPFLLQGQM